MKPKQPAKAVQPRLGKTASALSARDFNQEKVVWRVQTIDIEGPDFTTPYGWQALSASALREVIEHLGNLETMTWSEIMKNKKRNHQVAISSLCREAQKRVEELCLDDWGCVYSLGQMGGAVRIWGIRHENVLSVLWWDPEHKICPSHKKGT